MSCTPGKHMSLGWHGQRAGFSPMAMRVPSPPQPHGHQPKPAADTASLAYMRSLWTRVRANGCMTHVAAHLLHPLTPGEGRGRGEGRYAGLVRTRPHPRPLSRREPGGPVDQPRYMSCTFWPGGCGQDLTLGRGYRRLIGVLGNLVLCVSRRCPVPPPRGRRPSGQPVPTVLFAPAMGDSHGLRDDGLATVGRGRRPCGTCESRSEEVAD